MLYPIILLLIILFLYKIVFRLFDKKSKIIIKNATDVKEAINLRKKIYIKRKKVFVIFISIILLIILITSILDFERMLLFNLIFLFVLIIEIRYGMTNTELYGNISYHTPEDFLSSTKDFFLYLRGFDADIPFGEENKNNILFSESMFVEVVDYALGVPCCALGMTKEVDSPIGATRIYVEDDDWKDNVSKLMIKANRLFILVNNRNSCVWEIEQSVDLLYKTIFIVDDYEKYIAIRNRFINEIKMPIISDSTKIPFFFENGKEAIPFANNWKGYFKILGMDADEIEEKKAREVKAQILEHPLKL